MFIHFRNNIYGNVLSVSQRQRKIFDNKVTKKRSHHLERCAVMEEEQKGIDIEYTYILRHHMIFVKNLEISSRHAHHSLPLVSQVHGGLLHQHLSYSLPQWQSGFQVSQLILGQGLINCITICVLYLEFNHFSKGQYCIRYGMCDDRDSYIPDAI